MKHWPGTCITAVVLVGSLNSAWSQSNSAAYPSKPVRLIIGFAPGGASDLVARVIAPPLSEQLGKSFVVENRGGAGGTIGLDYVAKAAPDGYTLGLGSSGNLVMAPHLYAKIPYNVQKDLLPISNVVVSAYVIALNPTVPARTVAEFVNLAKASKGKLTYGTSGAGSTSHIAAELLRTTIGVDFIHVPYKGTGPALTAVVAGEIDLMVADLPPALTFAKSGRLRLIATVSSRRAGGAPDLPTMAESGIRMPPVDGRQGLVAPAGVPREIVQRLHTAIMNSLKNPDVKQRFAQMGFDVVGDTPEQFATALKSDGELFGKIIRQAKIEAD